MSRRDTACGLLAVAAVVIYMLACGSRPAWSPDSKRVVFAYVDERTETSGLALYNLETSQVKRIFESEEQVLFQPVWLGKADEIVALAARENNALDIIHVNLITGQDRLLKTMAAKDPGSSLMVPPVLADGRYLFFSAQPAEEDAEMNLYRFDFKSKALTIVRKGQERLLYRVGKEYCYLGLAEDGLELGTFSIKKLKFRRLVFLDQRRYGKVALGLAGKENGKELALLSEREFQGQEESDPEETGFAVLVINRRGKIVKEIPLESGLNISGLVNLVFGPADKTLWLSAVVKSDTDQNISLLLELDINKGEFREVISEPLGKDEYILLQPSVSPDGKWLAVDVLEPKDEPRSVLYLVDLTSLERKVTKVALPAVEIEVEPVEAEKTE
ncbi:MAG: PD40 domain-containing protein [Phycisphaerae bacterium]|nr:PD40 domain-containing protein [Phycisphaerae bacterium]